MRVKLFNKELTTVDKSFLELVIPAGTPIPFTAEMLRKYPMPSEKNVKVDTCLAALISHILRDGLFAYPHNRGKGKTATVSAKSVRAGVKMYAIGEATVGYYGDEKIWGTKDQFLCFSSFHSRMTGILERHMAGEMTEEEYMGTISCRYSSDFMDAYKTFGMPGPNHSTKEKLYTADLAFGEHVSKIIDAVGPDIERKMGTNKATILSVIIAAMEADNDPNANVPWKVWGSLYRFRSKAANRANELKGTVRVLDVQIAKLVEAIRSWYSFVLVFEKYATVVGKNKKLKISQDGKDIINSAGIFGLYISDYYSGQSLFFADPEKTASKFFEKIGDVAVNARYLCRGNECEQSTCRVRIAEILHGRKWVEKIKIDTPKDTVVQLKNKRTTKKATKKKSA